MVVPATGVESTESDVESTEADVGATEPDVAPTEAPDRSTASAQSTPPPRFTINLSPAGRRHGLGLLMAAATLAVLSWNLSRPALWLDESASGIATQRTWPNLWVLLRSAESPLVPFYATLKVLTSGTSHLFPHSPEHVEVFFRWPSVAAAVVAAWVLTVWLARLCPTPVVLGAGVFLLTAAGFSRYGQEARPYTIVMMFAVICTAVWTQLVRETRTRWRWGYSALYALTIVLMICANSLSATLIAAHLVASLVAPDRGRRVSALFATIGAAAIGLAAVEPLAVVMALNGKGATKYPPLNASSVTDALNSLVTIGAGRPFVIGALLPLAFLGLTRAFGQKYRFVARLAVAWALIPLVLWVCAVALRPNLLIGRYVLFVLPAWAVLAGLGTVTLFELVSWGVRRLNGSARVSLGSAWALTTVLLVALVVSQLQSLQLPRKPGGHGDDIRPALALANSAKYRRLPILPTSQLGGLEISSYAPQDESRLIGQVAQRNERYIWPSVLPLDIRRAQLRAAPRLILLMRISADPACSDKLMERNAASIYHCMPPLLQRMKYGVVSFNRAGRNWTFAELYRGGEPPATPAEQARADSSS